MAENKPKQEVFEFEGTKYVFQHPGHRAKTRMQDAAMTKDGKFSSEAYMGEVMKNVIVEPVEAKAWAYWDFREGFDEVMEEAIRFLRGTKRED